MLPNGEDADEKSEEKERFIPSPCFPETNAGIIFMKPATDVGEYGQADRADNAGDCYVAGKREGEDKNNQRGGSGIYCTY